MTKVIVIGAPSLTGKDANAVIKAAFEEAQFPLTAVLTSQANFSVSLPEVDLLLRPGAREEVCFGSFAVLQRTTSSLSQIADLNRLEAIVELSAQPSAQDEPEPEAPAGEAVAEVAVEQPATDAKPAATRKAK